MNLAEVLVWVRAVIAGPRFRFVTTPNVDHLVRLHRGGGQPWHAAFVAAEAAADLCINDSRVLGALARLSGIALPVVPGSDLTRELLGQGLPAGTKIALIGGAQTDAAWLRGRLRECLVVQHIPPPGVLHDPPAQQAIVDFVEAEQPALTLFAIGAPQSEIVAHRLQRRARASGAGLCIGASIEFLTGVKRRAPLMLQRMGLEWAFRLVSEPSRMWRRYLVEGPKVFAIWWRWRRERRASDA